MTAEMLDFSKDRITELMEESEVRICGGELSTVDVCALSSLLVSGSFPNVTSLVLRNNSLSDSSFGTLVTSLNFNSSVTSLDVGENEITRRGIYHLLLSLSTMNDSLKVLNL